MDEKGNVTYTRLAFGIVVLISIGTTFYHFQEGWGWINSLYFTVITLTTVGYGDFSPETDIGKLFTVVYVSIGIGIFALFINQVTNKRIEKVANRRKNGK